MTRALTRQRQVGPVIRALQRENTTWSRRRLVTDEVPHICGCESLEMARASRSSRWRSASLAVRWAGRTAS